MPKSCTNTTFTHQQDFFDKIKIFVQDFVPIRAVLMGTKSCTKILNFSSENLAVEDFVTLLMGKKSC